jgi:hypothetical protein
MKFLIIILENITFYNKHEFLSLFTVKNNIKHLGRWGIDYDTKIINTKIDLSNYDHCGSCGIKNKNKKLHSPQ